MEIAQHLSDDTSLQSLAADLDGLYKRAKASVGDADLIHIRNVKAYSTAIKQRSQELITRPKSLEQWRRGIVLRGLHTLLEFSELGHNVMHGGFDHLPERGEFDSQTYQWDFVTDPYEWRTMHHNNHHPFTNIIGKDHDIGYSFLRLLPGQSWYSHNFLQVVTLPLLLSFHLYYFTLYTAVSAARTQGRSILSRDTFRASSKLIRKHVLANYIREPLRKGNKFLSTALGNYLGTIFGYNLTIFVLIIEHHAENVVLFHDPGPDESKGAWYRRQILSTTNFTHASAWDEYFEKILAEEVEFDNPPPLDVFYGGLDTHLEHHLFPDLPCSAQRRIVGDVQRICAKHDLPYNSLPIEEMVPDLLKNTAHLVLPIGERETKQDSPIRASEMAKRIWRGVTYQPSFDTYLTAPHLYNANTKVDSSTVHGNDARTLRIALPDNWQTMQWKSGAYLSVRIPAPDGAEDYIRQYSLLRDSIDTMADTNPTLDITVKRVLDGRASNIIVDQFDAGTPITLVSPPSSANEFALHRIPKRSVLIAAGVGITPILSMMRTMAREAPNAPVTLLYFNRNEASTLHREAIDALCASPSIDAHYFYSEPEDGSEPIFINAQILTTYAPLLASSIVHVCAPPVVIDITRTLCFDAGLPQDQFFEEKFAAKSINVSADAHTKQYNVYFAQSDKTVSIRGDQTLLEAIKAAEIPLATGCLKGLCKSCLVTRNTGSLVDVDDDDTRITVCNAIPTSDIELAL